MSGTKKKTTKKSATKETKHKSIVSNEESIMTRLEVVEKMLVHTRDEFKEIKLIINRLKDRMGL
mgnify:CR=1 FL=1